jgi:hypothetical protein
MATDPVPERSLLVDVPTDSSHPWGMAQTRDLMAVDVHSDEVGDYNVTEAGWYAVDDAGKVVMGPFTSLAECERAMRDRRQHIIPDVPN